MPRVITSEIASFQSAQPRQPASVIHPATNTSIDSLGKILGVMKGTSDVAGSPLVGALVDKGSELYDNYQKASAQSEAEQKVLAETQAKYDTEQRQKQYSIDRQKAEDAQARQRLQAVGGTGSQLEQLGRDKREVEQLMLQNPPDVNDPNNPLQRKWNSLHREEERLRFDLRKQGGESEPTGLLTKGAEEQQAQGLMAPRTPLVEQSPEGSRIPPQIPYPQTLHPDEKDPGYLLLRLKDMTDMAAKVQAGTATPEEQARAGSPEDRKELRDRLSVIQQSLMADYLAQGASESDARQRADAILRAKYAELDSQRNPENTLAAMRKLPQPTEVSPTPESPATPATTPSVAPKAAEAPVSYVPDSAKASGSATSTQTEALVQRQGERAEQYRKEYESTVDSLSTAFKAAGVDADEARKRAESLASKALSDKKADEDKFMAATERFVQKTPRAEIVDGKAQLVKQEYEPLTIDGLVKLARLADTKEKQSRVYELAATVRMPYASVYDRFDPNRKLKLAKELEGIFPAAKKSAAEEAAELAYKFAKTQGVYAGIEKGEKQAATGAARVEQASTAGKSKLDQADTKAALAVDTLEERKRAAKSHDAAVFAALSVQRGGLEIRQQQLTDDQWKEIQDRADKDKERRVKAAEAKAKTAVEEAKSAAAAADQAEKESNNATDRRAQKKWAATLAERKKAAKEKLEGAQKATQDHDRELNTEPPYERYAKEAMGHNPAPKATPSKAAPAKTGAAPTGKKPTVSDDEIDKGMSSGGGK